MLTFDDGVHILGTEIHLDPRRGKPRAVVSHAHSDHVARHRRWVASAGTAALCARRWRARDLEVHEFGVPWQEGDATLTLLPAGHILGSSMVLVEREGLRILYTGDVRLKPGATPERCAPVEADILVMECTYGDPRYRFPDRAAVLDEVCDFLEASWAANATPVLLAYSLGKAQEVARLLCERSYEVWLHRDAHDMLEVYVERGVTFASCHRYDHRPLERGVLIVPPHMARGHLVSSIPRRRLAWLSGWAIAPRGFRPRCDAAFALSDHADFDELLELVRLVRPRRVYTLHGPDAFASQLRARGFDAVPARAAAQQLLL